MINFAQSIIHARLSSCCSINTSTTTATTKKATTRDRLCVHVFYLQNSRVDEWKKHDQIKRTYRHNRANERDTATKIQSRNDQVNSQICRMDFFISIFDQKLYQQWSHCTNIFSGGAPKKDTKPESFASIVHNIRVFFALSSYSMQLNFYSNQTKKKTHNYQRNYSLDSACVYIDSDFCSYFRYTFESFSVSMVRYYRFHNYIRWFSLHHRTIRREHNAREHRIRTEYRNSVVPNISNIYTHTKYTCVHWCEFVPLFRASLHQQQHCTHTQKRQLKKWRQPDNTHTKFEPINVAHWALSLPQKQLNVENSSQSSICVRHLKR